MEALKQRLIEPLLQNVECPELASELRWAANEAAALAWYTGYPMLVLPALLEEKVAAASKRWERQQKIWQCLAA